MMTLSYHQTLILVKEQEIQAGPNISIDETLMDMKYTYLPSTRSITRL